MQAKFCGGINDNIGLGKDFVDYFRIPTFRGRRIGTTEAVDFGVNARPWIVGFNERCNGIGFPLSRDG
jgi:hypothetical protein